MAVGPVRGLQGSKCNLATLDCLVAGPVRKLGIATALCVLEVFVAAGPARGPQSSNCNLTTWDCLGVRPSSLGLTWSRLNRS